jgi:hypothetical protein
MYNLIKDNMKTSVVVSVIFQNPIPTFRIKTFLHCYKPSGHVLTPPESWKIRVSNDK